MVDDILIELCRELEIPTTDPIADKIWNALDRAYDRGRDRGEEIEWERNNGPVY